MDDNRPWDWSQRRSELLPLIGHLTADDARYIVRRLLETENETYVAASLIGLVHGSVLRRMGECPACKALRDVSGRIAGDRARCACDAWFEVRFATNGSPVLLPCNPPASWPAKTRKEER